MHDPPVSVIAQSPEQIAAAHAAAGLARGRGVRVFTAPWMAAAYGVLGLAPGGPETVLDCGDDPAAAMAALRAGWRAIAFQGRPEVRAKLAQIAAGSGAGTIEPPDPPDIALLPGEDAAARLRAWADANRAAGGETAKEGTDR